MGFLRLSGAFHDSSILLAVDGGFIVVLLPDSFAIGELDYMVVCSPALLGSSSSSFLIYTVL